MYLRSDELIEVWRDVKEDPIYGSRKCDPSEKQDEQHEVGIGGREINHLQEEAQKLSCVCLSSSTNNS